MALSDAGSIAADVTSGATLVVSCGGAPRAPRLENGGTPALRGVADNASGSVNFESSTSTLTVVEGANT